MGEGGGWGQQRAATPQRGATHVRRADGLCVVAVAVVVKPQVSAHACVIGAQPAAMAAAGTGTRPAAARRGRPAGVRHVKRRRAAEGHRHLVWAPRRRWCLATSSSSLVLRVVCVRISSTLPLPIGEDATKPAAASTPPSTFHYLPVPACLSRRLLLFLATLSSLTLLPTLALPPLFSLFSLLYPNPKAVGQWR